MAHPSPSPAGPVQRLDAAAFGLIYGTITSLSILMAMGAHPDASFPMAAALFGSVFAVTAAKAFAEVISEELARSAEAPRATFADAWRHARPTLVAANVPTLLILASGFGLLSAQAAIGLAQLFGIGVLAVLGARVGWVARKRVVPAVLGALFTGGIGLALSAMKFLVH